MWNDIDLYHAVRDFTSDPTSFPGDEVRAFIAELVRHSFLPSPKYFQKYSILLFITTDCK